MSCLHPGGGGMNLLVMQVTIKDKCGDEQRTFCAADFTASPHARRTIVDRSCLGSKLSFSLFSTCASAYGVLVLLWACGRARARVCGCVCGCGVVFGGGQPHVFLKLLGGGGVP